MSIPLPSLPITLSPLVQRHQISARAASDLASRTERSSLSGWHSGGSDRRAKRDGAKDS